MLAINSRAWFNPIACFVRNTFDVRFAHNRDTNPLGSLLSHLQHQALYPGFSQHRILGKTLTGFRIMRRSSTERFNEFREIPVLMAKYIFSKTVHFRRLRHGINLGIATHVA